MKKVYKIIAIFLIILSLCAVTLRVYADDDLDIWGMANDFLGEGAGRVEGIGSVNDEFINIVDFLWGLGLLVVFISTIVLGIKYMLVSPDEKSRVKQATTPYIIGVVIIFGAVTIWKLVIDLLEGSMRGV